MDDDISQMIYNFSAGPAVLPAPVLRQAQEELPDWPGTGMRVMEMSHRGSDFTRTAETAEARLRELMAIPEDYRVLFLQRGATGQFAAVPMNLSAQDAVADYVITGMWGKRAHAERAKLLDRANVAASSSPSTYVPPQDVSQLTADADHAHIKLYAAVDESGCWSNPVGPGSRSRMNERLTLALRALEPVYVAEARAAGLVNLQGHRNVGGMGASSCSAMPEGGVDALSDFMRVF